MTNTTAPELVSVSEMNIEPLSEKQKIQRIANEAAKFAECGGTLENLMHRIGRIVER